MATIDTDFMARVYDNLTQFWDYSLSHAGMELDCIKCFYGRIYVLLSGTKPLVTHQPASPHQAVNI